MEKIRKFETEELLFNDNSLEHPSVLYTEDSSKVWITEGLKTISIYDDDKMTLLFTINAYSRMDWEGWVSSEYYDNRIEIKNNYVFFVNGVSLTYNGCGQAVKASDFINKST